MRLINYQNNKLLFLLYLVASLLMLAASLHAQSLKIEGHPIQIQSDGTGVMGVWYNGLWQYYYGNDQSKGSFLYLNGINIGFESWGIWHNAFVPVSNTMPSTNSIETVMDTGSYGVQLTQLIEYQNEASFYTVTWTLSNTGTVTYTDCRFIHGGDVQFDTNLVSAGHWNDTNHMIFLNNQDMASSGLMAMYGAWPTVADHYYEGYFYDNWMLMSQGLLSDSVDSAYDDVGYSLQWNRASLVPGATWQVQMIEKWTPAGTLQVLAPPGKYAPPGNDISYVFSIMNFDTSAVSCNLTAGSSEGWDIYWGSDTNLLVDAGASSNVSIIVSIPDGLCGEHEDTLTFQVSSIAGTNVNTISTRALVTLSIDGLPGDIGVPDPFGYGEVALAPCRVITNTVISPVVVTTGVRYVCSGWEGTGAVPESGSSTTVTSLSMTVDSQLTWLWDKEFLFSVVANNGQVVGGQSGWEGEGYIFDFMPYADPGYVFSSWLVNGIHIGNDLLMTVTSTIPYNIEAVFVPQTWDVAFTGTAALASFRYEGKWLCFSVSLCNPSSSGIIMKDRFIFTLPHTTLTYIPAPHGRSPSGDDYWDVTSMVIDQLGGATSIMPGQCVVIGELRVYDPPTTSFDGHFYARGIPDTTGRDTDHDRIPNDWENQMGLNENNPFDAEEDEDGDQLASFLEYIADTDPLNADSCLQMLSWSVSGDDADIRWKGGTSSYQYVEGINELWGDWQCLWTNSPPTSITNTWQQIQTNECFFYRIRARKP